MLKIKDDVDLKKLEKFGFEHHRLIYIKTISRKTFSGLKLKRNIYVDEKAKEISIGEGIFNIDLELETIYDLIKADLVEKVEE